MLLRLSGILVVGIGLAMWAVGDGPDKTRAELAADRAEAQRVSAASVSRAPSAVLDIAATTEEPVTEDVAPEPAEVETVAAPSAPEPSIAPVKQDLFTVIPAAAVANEPEPAPSANAGTDPIVLYVTGRSVNLRAGPSTNNQILGRVNRGDAVELVDFAENGWAKIRVSGVADDVFISGDFLSDSR